MGTSNATTARSLSLAITLRLFSSEFQKVPQIVSVLGTLSLLMHNTSTGIPVML